MDPIMLKFIKAVRSNDIETVKTFLDDGFDINSTEALLCGASVSNLSMVELLLANGADVNKKSEFGATALKGSLESGMFDNAELLISSGADVNAVDNYGETVLMTFIKYNIFSITDDRKVLMFKKLVEAGADINARDKHGETALIYVCSLRQFRSVDLIKTMLAMGANINLQDNNGNTALIHSCAGRHFAVFQKLMEHMPSVNTINNRGRTALMQACESPWNCKPLVEALVSAGADPNVQDKDGWTPLMFLASRKYTGLMKLLMKSGADMNIRNHRGNTALEILEFYANNKQYNTFFRQVFIDPKREILKKEDSDKMRGRTNAPDFNI